MNRGEAENNDRILEEAALFAGRALGAGGRENAALQEWLARDPRHEAAYRTMLAVAEDSALTEALAGYRMPDRAAARPRRRVLAGLAVAATVAGIAIFGMASHFADFPAGGQVYETAYGQLRTVSLEDGSKIALNGGTRLTVKPGGRSVALERGQAYFSVAHDPAHPFVVGLPAGSVTVLGTEFDLSFGSRGVELEVYQGHVRFAADHAQAIVFGRGQHGLLAGGTVRILPWFDPSSGDWRSGWIEPANWTLEQVTDALSRYSGMPIRIANGGLKTRLVTGRLRLTNPRTQLENLSTIYGFSVGQDGDGLVLR